MILYKYLSLETCRTILSDGAISFSDPRFFNDPFDLPAYPRMPANSLSENIATDAPFWFQALTTVAAVMQTMQQIKQYGEDEAAWAKNIGILSLTRAPTNPLLWAHYADQHRGAVIGIDVIAAKLADEATNLIPAQFGSVVYVSQRPEHAFVDRPSTPLVAGSTFSFPREHYEALQRLFLQKPLYWAYEEEVRVVKIARDGGETVAAGGRLKRVELAKGTLHLFSLPPGAVRELYFGARMDKADAARIASLARSKCSKLSIYKCNLQQSDFSVRPMLY